MESKKDIVRQRIEQDESLKHDIEFSERITKIFELFGDEEGVKALHLEHTETANLEQHNTRIRWTVFTTLTAVSFGIAGYVLSTLNTLDLPVRITALFFAWFVQFFATFFYWWMHNLAHHLRGYLQQLVTCPPKIGPHQMRDSCKITTGGSKSENEKVFGGADIPGSARG